MTMIATAAPFVGTGPLADDERPSHSQFGPSRNSRPGPVFRSRNTSQHEDGDALQRRVLAVTGCVRGLDSAEAESDAHHQYAPRTRTGRAAGTEAVGRSRGQRSPRREERLLPDFAKPRLTM